MPDPTAVVRPNLPPLESRVATAVAKIEAKKSGSPAPAAVPNTPAGEALAEKTAEKAAAAAAAAPSAEVKPGEIAKPAESEPGSRKDYINLAKAEAKLQAERRAFRAEQEELRRQQEATTRQGQYFESLKARARGDPDSVARELGLDYAAWTNQVLGKEATPDQKIQALTGEIENLKDGLATEREQGRNAEAARLRDEARGVAQQFRSDVSEFLRANGEQYEAINTLGLNDTVYGLIRGIYARDGKLLTPKEAADMLEEAAVEAIEQFVDKSKKWPERQRAKAAKATPQNAKSETPGQVRTVSNDMTPEAGGSRPEKKQMTQTERIEKAVESFRAKKAAES